MEKKKPDMQKLDADNMETKESLLEWHCDTYCRKIRHVSCEGEAQVKRDAPNLCPYFDEMLY